MVTPELLDYIRQHMAAGATRETIVSSLLTAGWPKASVDEAMMQFPAPIAAGMAMPAPAQAMPQMQADVVADSTGSVATAYVMPSSWALLKESFRQFRRSIGLVGFFVTILAILALITLGVGTTGSVGLILGWNIVSAIISSLISIWATAALVSAALGGEAPGSVGQNLRKGVRYIVPLSLTSLLLSFVVIGGFITFVVPFLAGVWALFISVIMIEEDRRGMAAIVRAREFTRGRWWMIMGYSLLNGILILLILLPVLIAGGILAFVLGSVPGAKQVLTFISTVASSFVPFFMVTWSVCLYRHLKAKRPHAEPFPKPGQMKWYWIMFGVGMVLPLVFAASAASTFYKMAGSGLSISTIENTAGAVAKQAAVNSVTESNSLGLAQAEEPVITSRTVTKKIESPDVTALKDALKKYFASNGKYPENLDALTVEYPATTTDYFKQNLKYYYLKAGADFQLIYPLMKDGRVTGIGTIEPASLNR